MKARDLETKKNLSVAELKAELAQTEEKLFRQKFKHGVAKLPNPMELRTLRRHVARLKTLMGQKARQETAR